MRKSHRPDERGTGELTRRLLAVIDRNSGDDALGCEARRLTVEKSWAEMTPGERETVRRHRADIDRRLVEMIERYESPGRTSPDS
ncbi:MAG: hypothetical protein LH654_01205 [Thermoleophilia bacterium]|nr:hypothetical protein [Thermoleophilia bacterium]